MTAVPVSRERYLARERVINVVVNAIISVVFYMFVFGLRDPVHLWAPDNLALDGLPQAFMIGFLGTLVPSLIARRARATGGISDVSAITAPIAPIVLRSLALGVMSALVAGGGSVLLLWASGLTVVPFIAAFVGKIVYGAAIGYVLAPIAVGRVIG